MFKISGTGRLAAFCAAAATALVLAACGSGDNNNNATAAPAADSKVNSLQSIRHVWVITLENEAYDATFGASSPARYLSQTLVSQGALLQQYYGTTHSSLGNYIAMISGQSNTADNVMDCATSIQDISVTGMADHGQVIGTGCVYPASVKTLPNQLKAVNLTWKGYMEDMGNDPTRERATCGQPAVKAPDNTNTPLAPSPAVPAGDQYAARHNPFVWFHAITDTPDCDSSVVNLEQMKADLKSVDTTANFNFITPNVCHDGHDTGCASGEPGGLTSADAFLQYWIPIIQASPAYQKDGLIIVNFDEGIAAGSTSIDTNASPATMTLSQLGQSCCNQQPGPNVTYPLTQTINIPNGYKVQVGKDGSGNPVYVTVGTIYNTTQSWGGDRTGAVLLSKFIKPGTVTTTGYNHYSLLKSLEDIFQVGGYLGYAGQDGLQSFGADIFTNF